MHDAIENDLGTIVIPADLTRRGIAFRRRAILQNRLELKHEWGVRLERNVYDCSVAGV